MTVKNQKSWKITLNYVAANHRLGREILVVTADDVETAHTKALKIAADAKLNEPRVVTCVEY